jgi:hypothetical protein
VAQVKDYFTLSETHEDVSLSERELDTLRVAIMHERESMIAKHNWRVESARMHDLHNIMHHIGIDDCGESWCVNQSK